MNYLSAGAPLPPPRSAAGPAAGNATATPPSAFESWSGFSSALQRNVFIPLVQGAAMGLGGHLVYYVWTWWRCAPVPRALPPPPPATSS